MRRHGSALTVLLLVGIAAGAIIYTDPSVLNRVPVNGATSSDQAVCDATRDITNVFPTADCFCTVQVEAVNGHPVYAAVFTKPSDTPSGSPSSYETAHVAKKNGQWVSVNAVMNGDQVWEVINSENSCEKKVPK